MVAEPVGAIYAALLRVAQSHGPTFSLMWRVDVGQAPAAHAVADPLADDLIEEQRVLEWPGTRVFGEPKLLRRYRHSDRALDVLLEAAGLKR